MLYGSQFLLLFAVVTVALVHASETSDLKTELKGYQDVVDRLKRHVDLQQRSTDATEEDIKNEHEKLRNNLNGVGQQLLLQQLYAEESTRAGGNSGIKQVHNMNMGTRAYFSATHADSRSVFAVHDHADSSRTVGLGELVVVMNGVEFRTRHNDYKLVQPSQEKTYHSTEPIEYPDVPDDVLELTEIKDQVDKMKTYFKAWKDQDTKVDYKKYFKPVMCYLEGAWTLTGEKVEEPFQSDRNYLDAKTWWELTEKVRFMTHSGNKDPYGNLAFLPKKIMHWNNDTGPTWAQWNYRILCAPLENDIPTKYLRPIDDLASRVVKKENVDEYAATERARFFLNDFEDRKNETSCDWCYIDSIMEQIPGKDNYNGNLRDDVFGKKALGQDGQDLNTAKYHRYFRRSDDGDNSDKHRVRGFSDGQLYMAQTSHKNKIPSLSIKGCQTCETYEQSWTYAIPLEIIYLTPLYKWNPYKIKTADDGSYYQTPEELFTGSQEDPAKRDVQDHAKNVQKVVASGTRVFLPDMGEGIGRLRTRYPIAPIYDEGNQIYKDMDVLKDLVLRKEEYQHMFPITWYPRG